MTRVRRKLSDYRRRTLTFKNNSSIILELLLLTQAYKLMKVQLPPSQTSSYLDPNLAKWNRPVPPFCLAKIKKILQQPMYLNPPNAQPSSETHHSYLTASIQASESG